MLFGEHGNAHFYRGKKSVFVEILFPMTVFDKFGAKLTTIYQLN